MFTPYVFSTAHISKIFKLKSCQLQTSFIELLKYPDFIFCDYFLFSSFSYCKSFKKINHHFEKKILFSGIPFQLNNSKKKSLFIDNIFYFSQPYEHKNQNLILEYLSDYSIINKKNIFIKPHPRDKNIFSDISNLIVEKNFDLNLNFTSIDIAIVRTSAIIRYLLVYNVPFIICLFTDEDKSLDLEFNSNEFRTKFDVFAYNINDLNRLLNDNNFYSSYSSFRDYFIKINNWDKDVFHMIKILNTICVA